MSDEAQASGGNAAEVNETTTVLGGVELEVTHLPEDAFDPKVLEGRLKPFRPLLGSTERVKVRQVLVGDVQRYGYAIMANDEATQIELYCGREPGWADTLTHESANAIADKGLDLNLSFFSAWYQRQARAKKVQMPPEVTRIETMLTELKTRVDELASRGSASTSQPSTT